MLAGNISSDQRQTLELRRLKARAEQMKFQISHKNYISTVALYDGEIAGLAVWILRLGKQAVHHPLQRNIRSLPLRERVQQLWMRFRMRIEGFLPSFLKNWIWPPNGLEAVISVRNQEVLKTRHRLVDKWMPQDAQEDYMILNSLTVLPEYEQRGIGRELLREGLEMAKEAGVPIYLVATPAGRGLYEKYGFQVMEECLLGTKDILTWTEPVMKYM